MHLDRAPGWIWRLVALVLIIAAATVANLRIQSDSRDEVLHIQSESAQTLYENQLSGCHRNNPRYAAIYQLTFALANFGVKPETRRHARIALHKIREAPYVKANGETNCAAAIQRP